MNFKRNATIILLALLAVGGLLIYSLTRPEDDNANSSVLFPTMTGVKSTDIDTLEISKTAGNKEKLVFSRNVTTKKWQCTSPAKAIVDQNEVNAIVDMVLNLKPVLYQELKSDLASQGLEKPSVVVTIKQGSSSSATLNIGESTIGGEKAVTFITTDANLNKPLAVKKNSLSALWKNADQVLGEAWNHSKALLDLRSKRLIGSDLNDPHMEVKSLKVKAAAKELALKAEEFGRWQFVSPADFGEADSGGDQEINKEFFTGVRPLLNALTFLNVTTVEDIIENPTPEDIAKFGLKAGDPQTILVELTDKRDSTETLLIGRQVEGKPNIRYAMLDGNSCVYKVFFDRYDSLLRSLANPTEMRNRDLLPLNSISQIDAIDITNLTGSFQLRKFGQAEQAKWLIFGGANDPVKQANSAQIDQLLQIVTRPRIAQDFPAKADNANYSGSELKSTVKLWQSAMNGIAMPELGKPAASPEIKVATPVILEVGKLEDKLVYVRKELNKQKTEFKLPELFLSFVNKPRIDFVHANVTTFPTAKVAKAILERPSGVYDLTKSNIPDPLYPLGKWTINSPENLKNQIADQSNCDKLIGNIVMMQPQKLISENPSEDELRKYGFSPKAKAKLSLELSDEPSKLRSYEIGNPTDDKAFYHARQGGNSHIFIVSKTVAELMLDIDFRESTLYRVDPTKVIGMTIKGWPGKIPVPPLHEYQLKDKVWSCTAPAGVVADPAKVNALLGHLQQPRAVRFLGKILPEHKLDADKAIEITLKIDGQPTQIILLGADLDGGQNIAASVSGKPGEAFAISATAIRVYAGNPNGLLINPMPMNPIPMNPIPMNNPEKIEKQ